MPGQDSLQHKAFRPKLVPLFLLSCLGSPGLHIQAPPLKTDALQQSQAAHHSHTLYFQGLVTPAWSLLSPRVMLKLSSTSESAHFSSVNPAL